MLLPAYPFVAQAADSYLHSLMETAVKQGLPGVSLRIRGPGIDFTRAAGVANIDTGEPLTVNHQLYLASLGKIFTASVVLQLCDEGRLHLDAPISLWLSPEVSRRIPMSDVITLRYLLNHRSGLYDYKNDADTWRIAFENAPGRQWTHGNTVSFLYDKPLLFYPGTRFDYSNSNYVLVGMIIEAVTGQPLHSLIRKRILGPLGLKHTHNGDEHIADNENAHGYIMKNGHVVDTYPWFSHYGLADSGMHSTPGDMALFIELLFDSEKVLSKRMRSEMTRGTLTSKPTLAYGMGTYVQYNRWGAGLRWYLHDGIDPGYQADFMYLPEYGITIVLAANTGMGWADQVYDNLLTDIVHLVIDRVTLHPQVFR